MLIPLMFDCQKCQARSAPKVHLNATSLDWKCPNCGHENTGFLETTVGAMILARSKYEYHSEKDFSMSILMAAMAFESELSRLFMKWKSIDAGLQGVDIPEQELDEMLRRHQRITDKIEEVCRLLVSEGLDAFAESDDEIREAITKRFPSLHLGSLAKDFQHTLFWPRNRILHTGYANYGEEEAARCYSISSLGLSILSEMDQARRKKI